MSPKVNWVILIVVLIGGALAGYRLFIDNAGRRTFQEYVELEGKGPVDDASLNRTDSVTLYRTGSNNVVCFNYFYSKDLHDRLLAKNGQQVTVDYDTSSNFGKVYGYTVQSVDGMTLANGEFPLRPEFAASSGVTASKRKDGSYSGGMNDCW
jgi:hypothetical protein